MQHDVMPIFPMPIPQGDLFGELLKAVTDYAGLVEKGKTRRQEISAKRDVALELIRNERVLLVQYLTKRFGEKAALYTGYFSLLTSALENQDTEIVRSILANILEVYRDDPCRIGIFRKLGSNSPQTEQI
ncbi:hypothetical protein [Treponema primitia]|uniref:hypothetical protein n=1 Tax=Treponema primitia TaxID=88058 RepID=UPI0002554E54|nr:hypothetical protein [Treponema primitia]